MKMIFNGTPINSMKVKHYELSTQDCDMIASDLQAGKTAVARGKKITGTGKSFEFASYGGFETNQYIPIPSVINVIEVSCMNYPVQANIQLKDMKDIDFTLEQTIGNVVIDGNSNPLTAKVELPFLIVNCPQQITLQMFYGKDNYI
jgi:hypothetical protein